MDVPPGWVSACPPGEFERHAAVVLSLTEMLPASPKSVVAIVGALLDRVEVIAVVRGEEQRQQAIVLLADWGLPAHRVHFVFMPVGTWTRDFGPSFVRWSDGSVLIVDAGYAFAGRHNEDVVPTAMAALLNVKRRRVPLALDGGNLVGNGRGLALFTSALVEVNRMHGFDYDLPRVRALMSEYYGFSDPLPLEPLLSHRTLHVDMFCAFTGPDDVVVGWVDRRHDPKGAAALDRNAALLEGLPTRTGRLRVSRVPMPPYDGTSCRTYTNVIFANGRLLVPHYPGVDRGLERRAHATYAALLPDWDIVPVDCGDLITGGGALRCLSAHVPWLYDRFQADRPDVGRRQPSQLLRY
jgi:agmatine/peptidylarginine deiminase